MVEFDRGGDESDECSGRISAKRRVGDAEIRIKQAEFVNVKGELGGKEKTGEGPLERATTLHSLGELEANWSVRRSQSRRLRGSCAALPVHEKRQKNRGNGTDRNFEIWYLPSIPTGHQDFLMQ
jgi:hypothetical protein